MSTVYKVKSGSTELCSSCGSTRNGGDQMVRLTDPRGERLGSCCWFCYQDDDDVDEKWGA
jgi:hypothetical protein